MAVEFPKASQLDGIAATKAAERSAARAGLVQTLATKVSEQAPDAIRHSPKASMWSVRLLSLTNTYAPIGKLGESWTDHDDDHRWLWTEGRAALEAEVRGCVPEDYAVQLLWDESGYPVQRYCYAHLTVAAKQQSSEPSPESAVETARGANKYV